MYTHTNDKKNVVHTDTRVKCFSFKFLSDISINSLIKRFQDSKLLINAYQQA